jgi:hypothetical protein
MPVGLKCPQTVEARVTPEGKAMTKKAEGLVKAKPAKKRWVNWETKPTPRAHFGVLRITEQLGNGKKSDYLYFCREIPSDIGVGVEFSELDGSGDCYQTSVDPEAEPYSGADHCCCPGHERWSRCKHVDCVRALIAQARLGW